MEIGILAHGDYRQCAPLDGVAALEGHLLEHGFLIVKDAGNYVGILTGHDVMKHPHRLVADCLGEVSPVQAETWVEAVLERMNQENRWVFPVFRGNTFCGVVTRQQISEYLEGFQCDLHKEAARVTANLTEQAALFSRILQTTPEAYWLVGKDRRILDVNENACTMLGYTREEILRMTISDIDAVESKEETKRRMTELLKNGYALFETRHRKKDGTIIDIEVRATSWMSGEVIMIAVFEIEDGGAGIDKNRRSALLDPLSHRKGFDKLDHLAFGLLIAREYVKMMGGDLTVENRPGKGSCFCFDLTLRSIAGDKLDAGRRKMRFQKMAEHSKAIRDSNLSAAEEASALPEHLRMLLLTAVEDGDMLLFSELLEQVTESHPALVKKLRKLADAFRYSSLKALLDVQGGVQ